ncbi:MAG: hypothetical protein QOI61_2052 [Actinomycetota bacterium]
MPSLDGIRGAALIAVLLFHSRFSWAAGGFLGVSTFFVLSGFLITGLLLRERDATGTIGLRAFWERRARRLAPALVVLLVVVTAYVAFATRLPPRGVVGDAIAASTWVANWRFVFAGHSYADVFSTPSPFQHMWSLAVEEQVYLLLPVVVLALLGRRGGTPKRWRLAIGLTAAAIASTAAAAMLHTHGVAPLHEYYGTDARAAEPVVGGLLALVLIRPGGVVHLSRRARSLLDGVGLVSLGGLVWLFSQMTQSSDALYRGGFLLTATLSALVIAAATQSGGLISAGFEPLAGLGRISYGAYLYHWPIFLWLSPARTGLDAPQLLYIRVVATITAALISYHLVEAPIRAGKLSLRIAVPGWANASVGFVAVLALVTMNAPSPAAGTLAGPLEAPAPPPPLSTKPMRASTGPRVAMSATPAANPQLGNAPNKLADGPPTAAEAPPSWDGRGPRPLRVAIIGDSMAGGLAQGLKGWAADRNDVITYSLATSGCPLSRGGARRTPLGSNWAVEEQCGWWADRSSDRATYLARFAPDVVVVQDGMNELPDRKLPSWRDYRHPGEPAFDQWLLSEYTALLDAVGGDQTKVLFLNAVCADWELLGGEYPYYGYDGEGDRRIQSLRGTAEALVSAGATVVDFYSHICPDGKFSQNVDGVDDARPDGYHLSDDAARALAERWLGPLVVKTARGVSLP